MDESGDSDSGVRWRRIQVDEGTMWLDSEFTAHVDTVPLGFARHLVYVTGAVTPDFSTTLEASRLILPPHTPVVILPGRVFGGAPTSRMALETTDQALAEVWAAAARSERGR